MEGVLRISNSSPLLATSMERETPSEFSFKSPKPRISFNKTVEPLSIKLEPRFTEAHLNHLCSNGRVSEAIAVLDTFAERGSKVKPSTFSRLIQSCIDSNSVKLGRKLHSHIGLLDEIDTFMETKLVGMYAKCGSLEEARKLFDGMRERNLYTWSAMIGAFSRERKWREVILYFYYMMDDDILPDEFLFPKILEACGNCKDVKTGKLIHSMVIRCGMLDDNRVSNSMLAVYAKSGCLSSARSFFEKMEWKDDVSWNSILSGYCLKGEIEEARHLFCLMQEKGTQPDVITWNILITSYNKFESCEMAVKVFEEMEGLGVIPDVITWTSMISGFSKSNRIDEALEFFKKMLIAGVEPNRVTLMTAISACASLKSRSKGTELHSVAIRMGFAEDVVVGNALIDMYSKCGKVELAWMIFDAMVERDVYSWNSMIAGYYQTGYCGKAHDLFMMMQRSDISPNVITWNVMITGYMQSGDEDQAMDLFHRMEMNEGVERDTASWNSLIAGYANNGYKDKAFGVFREMQSLCVSPNWITILTLLPACTNLVSAKKVKEIHCCVLRRNLDHDLSVTNSLLDAYGKSGNLLYSRALFDRTRNKDMITWNTIIAGLVLHGCSLAAIDLYEEMKKLGLKPNRGTLGSIITACALAKMVDKGKHIFFSMTKDYSVVPSLEHYVAMIYLFGRSGRLEEALEFIEGMDVEPDYFVWAALLNASRIDKNIKMLLHAGENLLALEPGDASIQRFVARAFALCGISEDYSKMRKPALGNETKESLGCSWIEAGNVVHQFVAGDQSKPNSDILYYWIRRIEERFQEFYHSEGLYINGEPKENFENVHSEKLAIAFTLVGSPQAPKSIKIMNNQRTCGSCHRMAKLITMVYDCEIYLSDSECLHHFKSGLCSCGDYW